MKTKLLLLITLFLSITNSLSAHYNGELPPPASIVPIKVKPVPINSYAYLRTLPVGKNFSNQQFYFFNQRDYRFDKLENRIPILSDKDFGLTGIDPIRFTITPNKTDIRVGDEIELTVKAELLNISPQLLFTLEELREYTLKVVLPNSFIQTDGTYTDFVTAKLNEQNPTKAYTIKGRYIEKPATDDCFLVLRKLNNEVFMLRQKACLEVQEGDFDNTHAKTRENTVHSPQAIDLTTIKVRQNFHYVKDGASIELDNEDANKTYNLDCLGGAEYGITFYMPNDIKQNILDNGGSYYVYFKVDNRTPTHDKCINNITDMIGSTGANLAGVNTMIFRMSVYTNTNCTGTPAKEIIQNVTINRAACPPPIDPKNIVIETSTNTLCPSTTATLTAQNCSATVTWNNGQTGASIQVGAGSFNAICSTKPTVTSNTEVISSISSPQAPEISTNKYFITQGETTVLSAQECGGTVKWFRGTAVFDYGRDISTNLAGVYKATCITRCGGVDYESPASSNISISILPIRLDANKTEVYANEPVTITASGCTYGYVQWRVNGNLLTYHDNPLTYTAAGTYEGRCVNFSTGEVTPFAAINVGLKSASSPKVTADKTSAYASDNIVLTATGCPAGWSYNWAIPVRQANGSVVVESRWGTPQTVVGYGTYQVRCWVDGSPSGSGPYESITIAEMSLNSISLTITPNKTTASANEAVLFTVNTNCPASGGIQWNIGGIITHAPIGSNYTVYGPGTYQARCVTGNFGTNWVSSTINSPAPGAVTIIANKTRAKPDELISLKAIGCEGANARVLWTLPPNPLNPPRVAGSTTLFAYGPGPYTAQCVRFGQTGTAGQITIASRSGDEPTPTPTQPIVATNQLFELTMNGCPNDWVQWAVPKKDASGNTYYDYSYFFQNLTAKGPGTYKVRCTSGNYTDWQDVIVLAASSSGLTIVASTTKAQPTENVTLTAYGCPNGTVEWKFGTGVSTGIRLNTQGPGEYMARCVGDATNDGSWAIAVVLPNGNITPIITASATAACPTQSVTLTASGCPAGWPIQWRYVRDAYLEYWLNNRNNIENGGVDYWTVFEVSWDNPIVRTGSRIYYARCLKPDYSWFGDFSNKSFTVEPAFPTDLRATNNGPSMTGGENIRLAVTEVPGATYQWTGPDSFSNNTRNPLITGLTAAKSGIYTCTLTYGSLAAGGCQTTATTNVKIAEANFRIKSVDPNTDIETNVLNRASTGSGVNALALAVINNDNFPMDTYNFNWTSAFAPISTPTSPYILVSTPGIYQVVISKTGTTWSTKLSISISGASLKSEKWAKMIETTMVDGTAIKVVPLKYSEKDIFFVSNHSNVAIPTSQIITSTADKFKTKSSLIQFNVGTNVIKQVMHVTPDFGYAQTHTTWGTDFTGSVTFRDYNSNSFLGGWRYVNGVAIGRTLEYTVSTGEPDDCYISQLAPVATAGTSATQTSSTLYSWNFENASDMQSQGYTFKGTEVINGQTYGRFEKHIPCYVKTGFSDPIPPGTTTGTITGQNPNITLPVILGGGIPPIRPVNEKVGLLITECFGELFKQEQIHLHRPDDVANEREDGRKFNVMVKLILEGIKKQYPTHLACLQVPNSTIMGQANSLYADGKINEAAMLIAANVGSGCSGIDETQYNDLASKVPDMMQKIKGTFLTLSKFLEDCTSSTTPASARVSTIYPNPCGGELIVNLIIEKIVLRGKSPEDVIFFYEGQPLMEESEVTNLWSDLSAGLPITTNDDGSQQVTRTDGTIIINTPTIDFKSGSLVVKNNSTTLIVEKVRIDDESIPPTNAYTREQLLSNPNYQPATTEFLRNLTTQNVGDKEIWQRNIIAGNALELAFRDFKVLDRNGKSFKTNVRTKEVKPDFAELVKQQNPYSRDLTFFFFGKFTEVKVSQNELNLNSFNNQLWGQLEVLSRTTSNTGKKAPKNLPALVLVVTEGTSINQNLINKAQELGVSLFVSYAFINRINQKVTFSSPEIKTLVTAPRMMYFPFNEVPFQWSEANRTWTQSNEYDER